MEILVNWPLNGEPIYTECGQTNIVNGFFKIHEKVVEINNK